MLQSYLLSCVTQEHYLFLDQIPKLREYELINTHPIVFTSLLYFHNLSQTYYPRPFSATLNVSYREREMGKRILLELMDHVTLQVANNINNFAVQRIFYYLISNGFKLETKSRAAQYFGGTSIHISFAVLHYMDVVYLNPIR